VRGMAGRANAGEPLLMPREKSIPGRVVVPGWQGPAVARRQAAVAGFTRGRAGTVVPGVERAPGPGRVSRVRNMETVRHEALDDRAEVKGLRRRVVAAARLELRAA
jgi:hypothetical protein